MTSSKHIDRIISPKWILPIIPNGEIFEDYSLAIHQGRIVAIEPNTEIHNNYTADDHLILNNQLVMPGLVNAHGHAAMSLMRGMADDLPLMTWLQNHIWPAESQWVDEVFVSDGTELAIAEMLKTGTTCFSDMYFHPEAAAKVADNAGIRVQIAFPILDFPTTWAKDADEYIEKGLKLYDDYQAHDRINIAFGPHAPYTVSDGPLQKIAHLAKELKAPIQIHVHETAEEVQQSLTEKGVRPLQRLFDLGVLTPTTQCVHLTQTNDDDIALLASSGAKVVHCPESNLKLASGACPITQLTNADIPVGLGTDGAASNNDLDMFGELASAAYLTKLQTGDATAGDAKNMLYMATLGGAKALGLESDIGSLEPGKCADMIAIKLEHISCYPKFNIHSNLVYNNRHIDITHTWVDGELLQENGQLKTLNESAIKTKATHWQKLMAGEKNEH